MVAVLTGRDAEADGIGHFPVMVEVPGRDGGKLWPTPREILQTTKVRFVGDPVALVVAETRQQAQDAAELVEVEYDLLPSVTDTAAADAPDAPLVWEERGSNLCVHWRSGREAEADAAFERAARTVQVELVNNRLVGNPMEPRVAIGEYDPATGRYTLHSPTQGVIRVRDGLAEHILKVPKDKLRVVSPDVGGGFGLRGKLFPESGMVLWAARRVGRPVKWLSGRTETFRLRPARARPRDAGGDGLRRGWAVLGVRIRTVAAMGAYLQDFGPRIPTVAGGRINGTVYDIQALNVQVRCVFTNTSPTDAYRGAGRPETAYVLERLLDAGAAAFGIGRDEIRRRNYIRPEQIPYTNAAGNPIDSGRFAETQEHGAGAGGLGRLPGAAGGGGGARQAARHRHRLLHRGLGRAAERMGAGALRAGWRGGADVGTFSHGQGHETAYAQVLHQKLGVPFDAVRFDPGRYRRRREGQRHRRLALLADGRRRHRPGLGAGGRQGERLAAHLLEAGRGRRGVRGRRLPRRRHRPQRGLGAGGRGRARPGAVAGRRGGGAGRAAALHPQHRVRLPERLPRRRGGGGRGTGQVEIVRYAAVDDVGNVINPMLVHGQSHGGIMAGIGQALLEHAVYDPESGQFLTASFQDYCMPRAADAPGFDLGFNVVPCPNNDLGVKGAGEGGAAARRRRWSRRCATRSASRTSTCR